MYVPHFLELKSKWTRLLLDIEWNKVGDGGDCNLMYLLMSNALDNFDFKCERF